MICVAHSLGEGPALGGQVGEMQLAKVIREGGFSRVRKATSTPFNIVLEARI